MNQSPVPAIEIHQLVRKYGRTEAVNGLNLTVQPGRCYGFFGRNGAGKTTTIKCLLNHLVPSSGWARVFGIEPRVDEVAVKRCLAYVPENVAFYPWMTVRNTLDYAASFRDCWNREIESDLLKRFDLDDRKRIKTLSKGMKAQVALICAVCPEPDLLLLDEPTSGLDPIVRREFIETVIGSYQEGDPGKRTVFVSTHLISEFEGLIDEFTIIEQGRDLLTLETEEARSRFKRIRLRFEGEPPEISENGVFRVTRDGQDLDVLTSEYSTELEGRLEALSPESLTLENLSLEEIFIAASRVSHGEGLETPRDVSA
jgi:ABC-2 type transport system ATP-binding protein